MAVVKRWLDIAPNGELFRPVRDVYTRRRILPLHSHDYVEITWIDRGRARHLINGRETWVEPGTLLFIRAQDCHGLWPADGETLGLTNVAFPYVVFEGLQRLYPEEMRRAFRDEMPDSPTDAAFTLDAARRRNANKWADELFFASRDRVLPIDRFVLNMLTLVQEQADVAARDGGPSRPEIPPLAPDWLVRAWRDIRQPRHLCEGVSAFFRLAGCSREHASRALRRHFGMTPSQCVLRARMEYAARRLEMSTRDIVEISLDCGFKDLAHFYKAFRAWHGTTPRAYRMSHRIQ